jgi:hypothetical protein
VDSGGSQRKKAIDYRTCVANFSRKKKNGFQGEQVTDFSGIEGLKSSTSRVTVQTFFIIERTVGVTTKR